MTTTHPPFEHLLAAYRLRIFRAAVGIIGEEQEAAEVAQDALLKAYRARDRYDRSRPFYPWLYRILRNTAFDALARRKNRAVPGLEERLVECDLPTALDLLGRAEAIEEVRAAMQTLGEDHREILSLRHFQELSYAEISTILGIKEGTVMSRLYRARKALLAAMKEGS